MRNVFLALIATLAFGVAQDKPAENKPQQKVAKDQAEADLINSLPKQADPNQRLQTLDKWTKAYPDTQFADERDQVYLATYQQMQKPQEAFNKAKEILAKHPNDFKSLYTIIAYIPYLNNGNPSAGDLDTAEQTSEHIIKDADAIFADSNKPGDVAADAWSKMRSQVTPLAQKTIGVVYFQRKDWPRAEAELVKALQADPTQAQASYMLANAMFSQRQKDPKKQPGALFEFARAANYDGPNALPPQMRQQVQASLAKMYKSYHGSDDGLNELIASAKTNALPPNEFGVESTAEIAEKKATAQAAADAANPMLALWRTIREQLTAEGGAAYWDANVKDAGLPGESKKFKGTIVSMTPESRPKQIVLAVEKPGTPDVTLTFETALPGKMEPGETLQFEGTVKAYTKDPYMLTFAVEKEQLSGWTGKNAPPAKKAAPKKKAE